MDTVGDLEGANGPLGHWVPVVVPTYVRTSSERHLSAHWIISMYCLKFTLPLIQSKL